MEKKAFKTVSEKKLFLSHNIKAHFKVKAPYVTLCVTERERRKTITANDFRKACYGLAWMWAVTSWHYMIIMFLLTFYLRWIIWSSSDERWSFQSIIIIAGKRTAFQIVAERILKFTQLHLTPCATES